MHTSANTVAPSNPAHLGGRTSFVYDGDAEMVRLATFMPRFPSPIDFRRVETDESTHWELALDLPATARIEYRLEITTGDRAAVILDPRNPEIATNPFGENSVATGPEYVHPWWRHRTAPAGRVREIRVRSRALGSRRHHHVYTPHGFTADAPLPLVVAHDGSDYFDHARLGECLDVLIAGDVIPATRVLLLDPVHRHREYVAAEAHATHLVDEVLPHVRRRFDTTGLPMVMGASLGAVASWHAFWTHRDAFAGMFLQSGTFAFDESPFLDERMGTSIRAFLDDAAEEPRLDGRRVMLTCGRYESLIDWNGRVAEAMRSDGDVHYHERWAGHDWGAWADEFEAGFLHLLGSTPV